MAFCLCLFHMVPKFILQYEKKISKLCRINAIERYLNLDTIWLSVNIRFEMVEFVDERCFFICWSLAMEVLKNTVNLQTFSENLQ